MPTVVAVTGFSVIAATCWYLAYHAYYAYPFRPTYFLMSIGSLDLDSWFKNDCQIDGEADIMSTTNKRKVILVTCCTLLKLCHSVRVACRGYANGAVQLLDVLGRQSRSRS